MHRTQHRDPLTPTQPKGCLAGSFIDQHFLFLDQLLDTSTAGVNNLSDQKLVQPCAGIFYSDGEMFRKCLHGSNKSRIKDTAPSSGSTEKEVALLCASVTLW